MAAFERDFARIDRWVDEFMARDLAPIADRDLWEEAQGLWLERAMYYMAYHGNATSLSMSSYAQMEGLMARWMGDKDLTQKLVSGLSGIVTAEIVPSLWEMARTLGDLGLALGRAGSTCR